MTLLPFASLGSVSVWASRPHGHLQQPNGNGMSSIVFMPKKGGGVLPDFSSSIDTHSTSLLLAPGDLKELIPLCCYICWGRVGGGCLPQELWVLIACKAGDFDQGEPMLLLGLELVPD